jgi:hypothetical protein
MEARITERIGSAGEQLASCRAVTPGLRPPSRVAASRSVLRASGACFRHQCHTPVADRDHRSWVAYLGYANTGGKLVQRLVQLIRPFNARLKIPVLEKACPGPSGV